MELQLLPDERLDDLQLGHMKIIQKTKGFRFGMDAVLLSDFAAIKPYHTVADFGTGTCILPLLLLGREKGSRFYAIELQPQIADMAQRTVAMNQLEDKISVHAVSVEQCHQVIAPGSLDDIICNPPYGMPGTTLLNPMEERSVARHQTEEGLLGWFKQAHRLLKGKGRLFMIYPAPRMLEVMNLLTRAHLEPKRIRAIHPYAHKAANLVMIEAMKDARPMLTIDPPLIVYHPDGSMTDELKRIYGNE
ncbi:MAG: methyltransferase [Clostridia bacterium]|nr:methyltransferase [Clostridia bacterium]